MPHINDEEVIMKKVKIAVLASMVGLLALFGVSAQSITHRPILIPAGATPATTSTAPTVPATPAAQTDQSGNHEYEGEEADSNGQSDNEAVASEASGTEKPDAEESATLEQGSAKSSLDAQSVQPETTATPDTDNVEVEQ